jgi:hypothetical protein
VSDFLSLVEELPEESVERALVLRNGLMGHATGGSLDARLYKKLRREFVEDGVTRDLLPIFVKTCHSTGDFWDYIKEAYDSYAERRAHIRQSFAPLIEYLEKERSLAAELISDVLLSYDEDGVHRAWNKALRRAVDDPEGAITAARSLLESVCKHILDEGGEDDVPYGPSEDLPKLYRLVSEKLALAPSQHTEEVFKRVLGGCSSVVEGLGSLRNKIGDAHGQGKRPVRVAPRHAHLAVNLAGTMAMFLIETWTARIRGRRSD